MSDTFKYLGDNPGPGSSKGFTPMGKVLPDEMKAQDYLKGKMKTIANASEGVVPGGGAYAKYGKDPNDTSTTKSTSNGLKGSKSAAEIRQEFGLIYDENNAPQFDPSANKGKMQTDDGHMWYKDSNGQTQYLGQVAGEYKRGSIGDDKPTSEAKMKGSDISMFHGGGSGKDHKSTNSVLQQAHDEVSHARGDFTNGFNSINDVANAMRHMMDGSGQKAAPEKERTPIEHSEEIKEAKNRVRAYEDDVMSGKTSNDIYGKSNAVAEDNYMDNYQLNLNKGQVGIGSTDSNDEPSNIATDAFLDSKKTSIKKEYQFQPTN